MDADMRKGKQRCSPRNQGSNDSSYQTAKASCCYSQTLSFPSLDLEVTQQTLDRTAGKGLAARLGHSLSSFYQIQKQDPDKFLLLSLTQGSRRMLSLGKSLVTRVEEI